MATTLPSCLTLILSISFAFAATSWAASMAHKTRRLQAHDYREEFEAHRCGRALAALENIRSVRMILKHLEPEESLRIDNAVKILTHRIELSLHPSTTIRGQICRRAKSDLPVASLYRYDRFKSRAGESNYGYRLISTTGEL